MNPDKILRSALWLSVPYNLLGALLFAFPAGKLGQLAGLPVPVPALYCTLLSFIILLFGGAYAWLATRPFIDRPLVALGAIGKAGFFAIVLIFWLRGEAPIRGVLTLSLDAIFAAVFFWWLAQIPQSARETLYYTPK